MNKKNLSLICKAYIIALMSVGVVFADDSDDNESGAVIIKSELATGPNKYLDKPIRNHGVVLGWPMGTLGFNEIGAYNPQATEADVLTSYTSDDAILATFLDPDFITAIGFDPADLDPSFLNIPLQQVKTLYEKRGPDGLPIVGRETLPGMFDEDTKPFQPSIASPNKTITLGDWKKARGKAIIKCKSESYSTVELKMKGLVPNRVYTVWSANVGAQTGPFNQPLGGAPSVFISNEKGNARFKRELNFCALELNEEVQAQMLWLMVVLHTDHMAYGGVFSPNKDSLFGGTVAHVHLHFPLVGEPVE